MVSVALLAISPVVAAAMLNDPGPTSSKVRPMKYPSLSVPVSELSKPTLIEGNIPSGE